MKLLCILLFLSSLVTNELVFDMIVLQDDTSSSLCENPLENQSEKENQNPAENETEIDYFTGHTYYPHSTSCKINAILRHHSSINLIPYLEIHSPPPE